MGHANLYLWAILEWWRGTARSFPALEAAQLARMSQPVRPAIQAMLWKTLFVLHVCPHAKIARALQEPAPTATPVPTCMTIHASLVKTIA